MKWRCREEGAGGRSHNKLTRRFRPLLKVVQCTFGHIYLSDKVDINGFEVGRKQSSGVLIDVVIKKAFIGVYAGIAENTMYRPKPEGSFLEQLKDVVPFGDIALPRDCPVFVRLDQFGCDCIIPVSDRDVGPILFAHELSASLLESNKKYRARSPMASLKAASPMPVAAPVMRIVFPWRLLSSVSSMV